GQWQQRGPHPAEIEADRRENPSGDRRSVVAHRQRYVRGLPRLRRANRRRTPQRHPLDARLHHMQGKAELVIVASTVTIELLIEFYREKFNQLLQHQAHARQVTQYDANNTYQYIINREDVQLTWLAKAIADGGGAVPDAPTTMQDTGG